MQFFIDNWMLLAVAAASGAMLLMPVIRGAAATGLAPAAAVNLINREKAVVVHVGDEREFAAGHVTGARHVPLDQLEARLPEVVKNKALPVLMVCASGGRALPRCALSAPSRLAIKAGAARASVEPQQHRGLGGAAPALHKVVVQVAAPLLVHLHSTGCCVSPSEHASPRRRAGQPRVRGRCIQGSRQVHPSWWGNRMTSVP